MSLAEELAWSHEVLGEAGPFVRTEVPRILEEAHTIASTHHTGLGLQGEDAYGLIWLKLPELLVEKFRGLAGVQVVRPHRARFEVPVFNGVPLVSWRYGKSATIDIDRVPFGRPVSHTRRSLFESLPRPSQMEFELGQTGMGDQVVAELSEAERDELTRFCDAIRELAGDGRQVAVLAFASNPSTVLRACFGYADLGDDDHLQWRFRRDLQLPLAASGPVVPRPRSASDIVGVADRADTAATGGSFDSGPVAAPVLRPRRKSDSS
jgi:hypothetical protein